MDACQSFKLGFIAHCIEAGFTTPHEVLALVKLAQDKLAEGGFSPLSLVGGMAAKEVAEKGMDFLGHAAGYALPVALAAPPILGAIGGTLAAKATDVSDYDVDEAKEQEVIDEYHRQSQRLKRENAARQLAGGFGGRRSIF